MRIAALILIIAWLAGPAAVPQEADPAPPAAAADQTRPRVVVRVSRNREVRGYLELETDEVIVVRDARRPAEKPESFTKARILQLVRLVDPQPDQRGRVLLRNGEIRDGVIVEDAFDHVIVEIEGIRARLKREDVDFVVLEPTIDERYAEFKAELKPGMFEQHLRLCRWLFDAKRYELCRQELEALIASAPDMVDATRLKGLVDAQLKLAEQQVPEHDAGEPEREQADDASRLPDRVLTHADVNIIRVFEIDFRRPPKIAIDPDAIRALIDRYGASPLIPATASERTAMLRADKLDLVKLMFELKARELYPEIQVLTEPYALNLFRQRVHDGWLMNNCATSRCHGGPYGGRLFLHRRGYKDERVRYTNLLILERLELDPERPLIDYDDPGMSLIIQYGLPRGEARLAHPDVKGWKPVFGRTSGRVLQETVNWIDAMMKPRPEYPVDFEPETDALPDIEKPVWGDPDRAPR